MLFTGSVLTRGQCRAVVTATGSATELGAIAQSLRSVGQVATPRLIPATAPGRRSGPAMSSSLLMGNQLLSSRNATRQSSGARPVRRC